MRTLRLVVSSTLAALVAFVAPVAVGHAQQPAPAPAAVAGHDFTEVAGWLTKAADIVPADKYGYRPVATVRTLGDLFAHAADGMNWYCASATEGNVPWSDPVEKGPKTKEAVTAALKAAVAKCQAAYAAPAARLAPLVGVVGHSNLHYGNIVTYMRMLGLTPPSS
jgi:uncharacterized damage-inducible protein DinB